MKEYDKKMTFEFLDNFCGSTFWDSNLTWYTDNPEFTPCFEKTVLIWVPCLFLWLFAALEVYYILNSKERFIPWSLYNVGKLLFTFLLIILSVVDGGLQIYKLHQGEVVHDADIYLPVIKMFTFALSGVLVFYNKKYGLRASGIQFFFWMLCILGALSPLRSEISKHDANQPISYSYISILIYFSLLIVNFILSCFVDLPPKESPYKFDKPRCPETSSGFPARLVYSWFDSMAFLGWKRSLVETDLWALNPEDSSKEVVSRFYKHWNNTLDKHERSNATKASYSKTSARVDFQNSKERKPASILPALCLAFGGQFLFGSFLKLINDILMFVSPQLLSLVIGFVEGKESLWKGYLYASLLFLVACVQTFLLAHYFTRMYLVGMKIRTALTSAIYAKALRMSNAAKKDSTIGEIVNLMAVDAHRFLELTAYLNMIWSAPLQIVLALFFLWRVLGPSVLAGLAVMIILIPVNGMIANKIKQMQIKQMKYKDERVKLMNEVLNGIKVLKMYAWEPSYQDKITNIRNKELQVLKTAAYYNSATSFIWSCAPFLVIFTTFCTYLYIDPENNHLTPGKIFVSMSLFFMLNMPLGLLPIVIVYTLEVSLVSFATYVLISDENILDSKTAFVSLSLFNILRFPLSMLPNVISNLIQTAVGVKRLNKFMNCDELDSNAVEHDKSESNPLHIENGNFVWDTDREKESFSLKNINVTVKEGTLLAIVGSVGSGKTSLVSALLGEMNKVSGRVNTKGTIAYVPQQAWIQNASLKDNILFGHDYDKIKYNNIIDRCALKTDLEILPGGDETEIGEKGINLSGGQKQRVSLARAVYADCDNYFLDDPLSAVDAHVGKHIFEEVLGPKGLLKNKTRVWVTHGIVYLPHTDYIVVMKDGAVQESGTYQELLDKKGEFADFLLTHITNAGHGESEVEEIKQQLESKLGSEFHNKLQRARSLSESASESEKSPGAGDRRSSSAKKKTPDETPPQKQDIKTKLIEVEKAETGKVKWSVYKHYLTSVGIVASIVTIAMNLILQVFQIGSNFWLTKWSGDSEVDNSKRDMYLGVYGALGAGQVISVSVSSLALYLGTLVAARVLHSALLTRVLRAPTTTFFDVTPTGRILNRFSKDVEVLDNVLPMTLRGWTSCFFSVLGTLFVISYSTPIFVVVIVPVGIIYYFIQRLYVATSRQLKRLESISRSPIYSHFSESISGATTIRAYGVSDRFILESERGVDHNQECYYPSCISNRWLAVRLEIIGNFIIFFSALFAVLSRETMDPGVVGLSVSYALQITQTLNWLVRMTSDVETNIVAVERIKEYAETETEAPWEILENKPPENWPHKGAIELNDLSIAYRPDTDIVLKGVTCSIKPGHKVGIVGRTGAGKSTLTLGLFRIVEPRHGYVKIDGVDIAKIGLHEIRSKITVIPQEPVLFSGTLRTNLDPFDKHRDADLWRSLQLSHLDSFVNNLPAKLEHEITEGGGNLSAGQRQLVCLARALLRKSALLILDEATAAVDLDTDQLVQRTIREEFANSTVLTIAHRLDTVADYDEVMVLDRGELVEYDSPSNLVANKNSIYYSMAKDAGLVN